MFIVILEPTFVNDRIILGDLSITVLHTIFELTNIGVLAAVKQCSNASIFSILKIADVLL